jgi:hypothetical protein
MINTLFTRAKVLARFQQSILEPHLSDLAGDLHEHGYCDNVIRAYLGAAEKFGRWLSMANLNTSDVNEDLIARYLDEAVRPHPPSAAGRSDSHARTGLAHLMRFLREKQVSPPAAVTPPQTAAERWLSAFEQHLVQVAGSALNTRKKYLALARRFVTQQFGDGPVDWAQLQADHVAAFVTREAGTKRGFGRKAAPVAIRAVLRFLVYSGDTRAGLEAAVPAMRNWKHAALPRHVSADDLERVLSLFRDASGHSRNEVSQVAHRAAPRDRCRDVAPVWRRAQAASVRRPFGSVLRFGKRRISESQHTLALVRTAYAEARDVAGFRAAAMPALHEAFVCRPADAGVVSRRGGRPGASADIVGLPGTCSAARELLVFDRDAGAARSGGGTIPGVRCFVGR